MTLSLGTMGLFGAKRTVAMGEARMLVNEAMEAKKPVEKLDKSEIVKYLNAFEVHSALFGLNPKELERYSALLKYC